MGILLVVCAVLVTLGLARLLELNEPEASPRVVLPPPMADQAAPAQEPPSPDVRAEAAPPQPEPVTPAPAPEVVEEETAASEQAEEPESSVEEPAPVASTSEDPPEPARGFLFINSRPWGRVLIDGQPIGNTPVVRVPIAPGTHQLRVERDGYHPFETIITVGPGADVRMTEIVLRSVI